MRHAPAPARWLETAYASAAVVSALAFAAGGSLLAVVLPYSDWDSFAFGDWSRTIALGGSANPVAAGAQGSARPLFYLLQGALWSVTGISFTAGRLLSLGFGVLFVAASWWLVRAVTRSALAASLAAVAAVSIPSLAGETLAGKSDVPAAAFVAVTAALVTGGARGRARVGAIALAALLAVLAKQTSLLALAPLVLVLPRRSLRALALVGGLGLGLVYDEVMAVHFHAGLLAYLRSGASDGLWAQRAATARWHALLDAGVLGPGLRLPLLFGLAYGSARLCRVRHRPAAIAALVVALVWSLGGPVVAGVGDGSLATPEAGAAFLGFAAVLVAFVLVQDEDAPALAPFAVGIALAVPPLAVWVYSTAYVNRLASGAWAGSVLVIAVPLASGLRKLLGVGLPFALTPLPLALMGVWISLASLNGLHGHQWVEFRGLGLSGLRDRDRALNIVLPDVQAALDAARPALGGGRLVADDPRFAFFLPGRVDTDSLYRCRDVGDDRVAVISTSDESVYAARQHGGLVSPAQWAACRRPRLTLLSQDSAFAVFRAGA